VLNSYLIISKSLFLTVGTVSLLDDLPSPDKYQCALSFCDNLHLRYCSSYAQCAGEAATTSLFASLSYQLEFQLGFVLNR